MAIPAQRLTIRDPGLGLTEPSDNRFAFFGTSSKGTVNTLVACGSPAAVVDTFGEGPLAEALAHALDVGGGPVYGCRLTGTVVGVAGAVTAAPIGTATGTVTVAGAPYDRYQVIVEITKTGTVATGEFRFSLDNGRTWAEPRVIPGGAAFAIPRTNLTITFVPGAGAVFFERGDRHTFTTTAPHYSSTELNLGVDALVTYLSVTPGTDFDALVFTGRNATGAAAAVLFGALSVRLAGLEQTFRYLGAFLDGGSGDTRTAAKTAFAAVTDTRIVKTYGDAVIASSKPFAGFGAPLTSGLLSVVGRALAVLPSTDLARYADGALKGVTAISHDEFVNEEMDAAGFATLRTWPGSPGYYITNARMSSPPGSDYQYWQHRRCMDIACRTVIKAQQQFASMGFGTNPDGTIDETDAKNCEALVNDQLRVALIDPKNAEGRRGHVDAFSYQIDRTNLVLQSQTLMSATGIRPRFYAKQIVSEIGFSLAAGA